VNRTDVTAAGGAAALTLARNPAQTASAGLAGSIALNDFEHETLAFVRASDVSGVERLFVHALSGGEQIAVAIGTAALDAVNPQGAGALAGSVSITKMANVTSASIEESEIAGAEPARSEEHTSELQSREK